MQRGLPRGSFEQNEADEYHTGFAHTPGGARSDPPEAVDCGVPPKLARVESVVVVAPRRTGGARPARQHDVGTQPPPHGRWGSMCPPGVAPRRQAGSLEGG